MLGWVLFLGCWVILKCFAFLNPNAGLSLLVHFIGLFLIFFSQVLGHFKMLGFFKNPNAGLSLWGHFIGLFLIKKMPQVLGHFKMLGFFKPKCWVKLVGSFYWVVFNIFFPRFWVILKCWAFFKPKCWVKLVGPLYWVVFCNIFPRCWVILTRCYFFLPNCWVDPVSGETMGFFSPQERVVLSAGTDSVHSFREIKFCIHLI